MRSLILLLLLFSYSADASNNFYFIENKGQVTDQYSRTRNDIDFVLRIAGLNIFVGAGMVQYQFTENKMPNPGPDLLHPTNGESSIRMCRLDMELVEANKNIKPVKSGLSHYYENYYLPQLEGGLAHAYAAVTYADIYPGIDWVLYVSEGKLEYDFVVHEGADAQQIKLQYKGATSLQVNADGSFTASTAIGSIRESAPVCYDGTGKPVGSRFHLKGDVLSYIADAYDGSLHIDPTLSWATYFGGNKGDYCTQVTTDQQGNVYMNGRTKSTANMATVGGYDETYAGQPDYDGFVCRFSPAGVLLWSTYYGGSGGDFMGPIVCDGQGNVYTCGTTNSASSIASIGSFQDTYGGNSDVFLVKFNPNGQRLWATYYGGTDVDDGAGVIVDGADNVYMTGSASSYGLGTNNTYQPLSNGGGEAIMVKFDPNGNRIWATYIGGSGGDRIGGIGKDYWGHIYITGYTNSTNTIATPGKYKTSISGNFDAFVFKFDTSCNKIWGTYWGGNSGETPVSVVPDHYGNVTITGYTSSTDIATTGAHQQVYGGGNVALGDFFLAQLDSAGSNLHWATYLGGSEDEGWGYAECDYEGSIYLIGSSESTSGITTTNAYQPNSLGGSDNPVIVKFGSSGTCMWASYFGGYGNNGYGLRAHSPNELYICGIAGIAISVPVTQGCHQDTMNGAGDGYLAKFNTSDLGVEPVVENQTAFSVSPNPGNGIFLLQSNSVLSQQAELEVVNIMGQPIYRATPAISNGKLQEKLDISAQPCGLYFLNISDGSYRYSLKLVKQ